MNNNKVPPSCIRAREDLWARHIAMSPRVIHASDMDISHCETSNAVQFMAIHARAMSMKLDHPAIQWAHKLCDIWKPQFCGGARERSHKFIHYKNHRFTIYYKPRTREWLAPVPIRKLGQTSLPRRQPPPFGNHSLVQLESYWVQESFREHPVHRLGAKVNENA